MRGEGVSAATPHIIVTAGPTHEPIDPVRYIANRSSGKQGFAIAAALAAKGAQVTLIAGPVTLDTPPGVTRIDVETARDMAAAVEAALPADAAIMVAAVADWRVESARQKIKKDGSGEPPVLHLVENPDILATLARSLQRPRLLVGFAAETENVIANAQAKLARKGCDWIVANDVSGDVMGGEANTVHVVTANGVESWAQMAKDEVAALLAGRVVAELASRGLDQHVLESAGEQWLKTAFVIAKTAQRAGLTGDDGNYEKIAARICALTDEGVLEAAGDLAEWHHSEVRVSPRHSNS
jgi:phosphopantothenoylcysteine synthetase/decarboxylase